MLEAAGDDIKLISTPDSIIKYRLGDMTSTVYWVNGSFEDWAYGAGWDFEGNAAFKNCTPSTYKLDRDFMKEDMSHVRTAVYLIETDNSKQV